MYYVVRCTALHSAFCMSSVEWCTSPVVCCLSVACWLLHIACGMLSVACCVGCVRLLACGRSMHRAAYRTLPTRLLRVRTRRCLPSTPPELAPHLPTPQHVCSMHVVAVLVTLNDFGILSVRNVQGRTVCDGSLVREHHTHGTGRNAVDRPGPRSNPEDCKTELTNLARPM